MEQVRKKKGQSIVEFAMLLAFVTIIGLFAKDGGLQSAIESVFEPAAKILYAIDHYNFYDVQESVNTIKDLQNNTDHYNKGANAPGGVNYIRGMMRSGWVDKYPEDASVQKIKELADEVGATQWSYLNGYVKENGWTNYVDDSNTQHGIDKKDVGLYWTVQELKTGDVTITPNHTNNSDTYYSEQLVLQYYYSEEEKRYYVILSHVWVEQSDLNNTNKIALGGLHKQYYKPEGKYIGNTAGYATLGEAKEVFETVRIANNYNVIFADVETAASVLENTGIQISSVTPEAES